MKCKCGEEIDSKEILCTNCGAVNRHHDMQKKERYLCAFLSFLFPGIGQIYGRRPQKGIIFSIVGIIFFIMTMIDKKIDGFYLAFWLFNIYNAYKMDPDIDLKSLKYLKYLVLLF